MEAEAGVRTLDVVRVGGGGTAGARGRTGGLGRCARQEGGKLVHYLVRLGKD